MRTLALIAAIVAATLAQKNYCDEVCPTQYNAVCGSDGRTYFNECTLRQKACLEKSTLSVASVGECFAEECAAALCQEGTLCVPQPKQCVTTPCEQFACLPIEQAECSNVVCPQSSICEYEPKQCVTTPCPQYNCVEKTECDIACTMDYRPVCGSNFKTYSNLCVLEAEACYTKTQITSIYNGECSDIICDTMCTENYEPVCGSDGVSYGNLCQLQAKACQLKSSISVASQGECPCVEICAEVYEPVCGTDGITYGNLCQLTSNACLTKSEISVQYDGECCETLCTEEYQPVCASNGRTYSNLCNLKAEACLSKSQITVAREKECDCPEICTKEYNPVCGSDRLTYGNLCMLKLAACESSGSLSAISVDYAGECLPECPEMCIENYEPVCGSDGVTYNNDCELLRESCRRKAQITKISEGQCNPECPAFCANIYLPVCGSDGVTYSSPCLLNYEACRTKTAITIVNDGECAIPNEPCPMCAEIYDPVCGNDLNTYPNECSLMRDNCLLKRQISVLRKGECSLSDCPEVCTDDYNPVCGSDGVTYGNLCSFLIASCKNDLSLKIANVGGCPAVDPPCMDMCAEIYAPVCGNDGVTYENECRLSSISCHGVLSGKSSVSMISKGECLSKDTQITWDVMLKFDINNDLTISRSEFENFAQTFNPQSSQEENDKLFAQVDLDGNQLIDEAEYKKSGTTLHTNSTPSKSNTSLYIGLGVGIAVGLIVIVAGLALYKRRSQQKSEEYNHIPHQSQPYNSLE